MSETELNKRIFIAFHLSEKLKSIAERIISRDEIIYLEEFSEQFSSNIEVMVVRSWQIAKNYIRLLPNLKYIQHIYAGIDNINLSEVPKNVSILSNSGANSIGVAEHALALLLAASKYITIRDSEMRDGLFIQKRESILLHGKKALIIGTGNVGKEIARRLRCFNVYLIGVNRSGKNPENLFDKIVKITELSEVLPIADFCIIALPLTPSTEKLIGKRELDLMKKNAILVNVGRGKIIDENALYEHLLNNREFIAALDVWWRYPKENELFAQNYDFSKLQNVIMTPHCAGVYENYEEDLIVHALSNIRRILNYEE